jgi:HNH endonuclease
MSDEKHSIRVVLGEHYSKLFWAKVNKTETCWLWIAGHDKLGYGKFHITKRFQCLAHRLAYQIIQGKIPENLELDHLCRVPSCVNPEHLEPVTHRVNIARGEGPFPQRAKQEYCIHGHTLHDAPRRKDTGTRYCRYCNRLKVKKYKDAKRRQRH